MALINLDDVLRQIRGYEDGAFEGLLDAMRDEADRAMALSKAQFVPIDTGALKRSGRVEGPDFTDTRAWVDMIYGDEGVVDYAVIVHENPNAFHQPPTQWKYLEHAIAERRSGMERRIGVSIVRRAKQRAGIS